MATTFGNRPEDVVADSRGNVLSGVVLQIYPTEADANAQTAGVGQATTDSHGSWPFTDSGSRSLLWVRDPGGRVWPVGSEQALGDISSKQDAATLDTAVGGHVSNSASATRVAADKVYLPVFTPEKYGAVGNGIADDTQAVRDCFDAANALKRTVGNYYDPGAIVLLRGTYKLTTLAASIDATCNVDGSQAHLVAPSGYTGTVLRVGGMLSGKVLQNASIVLPKISGNTVANLASLPAGGIGVLIRNLYTSQVKVGNLTYFETCLQVGGESHGVAYNEITLATMNWYKVGVRAKALDASGWSNQNTYVSGALTGSSPFSGNRASGVRAVVLDGTGSNTVTGNTFIGSAFESDVYEYVIEFKNAYQNQFIGCRHEQGVAATSCTVSGDTITATAHGLSVGSVVIFTATSSTPTGMSLLFPYYITATPTADTFKVSAKKGGTAITFTTAGSGVGYYRPQTVMYDKSWDNTIDKPMTPNTWLEQVYTTVTPADIKGNTIRYADAWTVTAYAPSSWPAFRARNSQASAGNKILWAAYPAATDPNEDPAGWTAGLGDKGLHFSASGAETGWVSNAGGVLKYQKPADSVVYELASCRRTQTGTTLASATTYNTGTRTTGTVTLTGIAAGDYVAISTSTGLPPLGLTITAQVTAADTITYAVDNNTGANITLGSAITLWFMVTRRFF